MAELVVRRNGVAWSTWNVTKNVVGLALERAGLPGGGGRWRKTADALRFTGTETECDAVELALEGLALDVARVRSAAQG
jgi:hypothetical protein